MLHGEEQSQSDEDELPNFTTVDHKIAETEFFLRMMCEVGFNPLEFNWYFSAYLSAARTTTLALQHFNKLPGFDHWYSTHRQALKDNELARFYLETRNDHVHGGEYPVSAAKIDNNKTTYFFARGDIAEDVVTASRRYFVMLLTIVHDCYCSLGVHIDSQQYFTKEYFSSFGKTVDDAEIEVWGFVRTSLIEEGYDDDDRWAELRANADHCEINHLFYAYLGRTTPQPVVPEHFEDFAFSAEEKGWNHIPAGFRSARAYWKANKIPFPKD